MEGQILILLAGIFLMAVLYSLVGHGGASGYIAIMALFGFVPTIIRPTALVLNIVVSLVAAVTFMRTPIIIKALSLVLVIAGMKMMLS